MTDLIIKHEFMRFINVLESCIYLLIFYRFREHIILKKHYQNYGRYLKILHML
jgi:hypothetical protein